MGTADKNDEIVRAFFALNLIPPTTAEEVERAYKRLATLHHPDRPGGDAAKFQEVQAARAALLGEGERLGAIKLHVSSAAASPFDDLLKIQEDLHASKKQILELKRGQREDQEAIAAFRARSRSKIQIALTFSAICLAAATVLGVISFGDRLGLAFMSKPSDLPISPGSFQAYEELGEVTLHFDTTSREGSTVSLKDPADNSSSTGVMVELDPGAVLRDGSILFVNAKRFRLRASDVQISLGRGDVERLRSMIIASLPVASDTAPAHPSESDSIPTPSIPDPASVPADPTPELPAVNETPVPSQTE